MKKNDIKQLWILCLIAALFSLGLSACGDDDDDDTETGDLSIDSVNTTGAGSAANISELPPEISASEGFKAFSGALALALQDEDVQGLIEPFEGGGAGNSFVPRDFESSCVGKTPTGQSALELDFSGCSSAGLAGTIIVTKQIGAPIVVEFQEFTIKTFVIAGMISLDRITGKQLTFNAQTVDAGGAASPVTMTRSLTGETSEVTFDGKVKTEFVTAKQVLIWGVSVTEVTGSVQTSSIILGGGTADAVKGDEPPGTALAFPIRPVTCYCPTTGVAGSQSEVNLDEATIDLNTYYPKCPIDVPDFKVPVTVSVSGLIQVTFTECGVITLDFEGESEVALTEEVSIATVAEMVESHCTGDTRDWEDNQCDWANRIIAWWKDNGTTNINVDFTQEDVEAVIETYLDKNYDLGFCAAEATE